MFLAVIVIVNSLFRIEYDIFMPRCPNLESFYNRLWTIPHSIFVFDPRWNIRFIIYLLDRLIWTIFIKKHHSSIYNTCHETECRSTGLLWPEKLISNIEKAAIENARIKLEDAIEIDTIDEVPQTPKSAAPKTAEPKTPHGPKFDEGLFAPTNLSK